MEALGGFMTRKQIREWWKAIEKAAKKFKEVTPA
jgi:hypothetical protein